MEKEERRWNGLLADLVERRCRPLEDRTQDADWKCMSSGGFLAPEECLGGVVERDAHRLRHLSTSAPELARRLAAVLDAAEERKRFACLDQEFRAKRTWYVGEQLSPFYNPSTHSPLNAAWKEEWKIRNVKVPLYSVLISGSQAAGILVMMKELGFFEGGLDGSNKYRIDPDVAVAVLAGQPSEGANEYMRLRLQQRRSKWTDERRNLIRDLEPNNDPEAQAFLNHRLSFIDAKLAKLDGHVRSLQQPPYSDGGAF